MADMNEYLIDAKKMNLTTKEKKFLRLLIYTGKIKSRIIKTFETNNSNIVKSIRYVELDSLMSYLNLRIQEKNELEDIREKLAKISEIRQINAF